MSFYDETAFVERLRALDDDDLLLRLRAVEQAPDAYRPGVQEAVKAEVARRGLSVAWAARRPEPQEATPTPGDVAKVDMLAGVFFLVVSALAMEILRFTGWYDDAQLVGGPLATLGGVWLLQGLPQHSRTPR